MKKLFIMLHERFVRKKLLRGSEKEVIEMGEVVRVRRDNLERINLLNCLVILLIKIKKVPVKTDTFIK